MLGHPANRQPQHPLGRLRRDRPGPAPHHRQVHQRLRDTHLVAGLDHPEQSPPLIAQRLVVPAKRRARGGKRVQPDLGADPVVKLECDPQGTLGELGGLGEPAGGVTRS
jgi:hypothetical protein